MSVETREYAPAGKGEGRCHISRQSSPPTSRDRILCTPPTGPRPPTTPNPTQSASFSPPSSLSTCRTREEEPRPPSTQPPSAFRPTSNPARTLPPPAGSVLPPEEGGKGNHRSRSEDRRFGPGPVEEGGRVPVPRLTVGVAVAVAVVVAARGVTVSVLYNGGVVLVVTDGVDQGGLPLPNPRGRPPLPRHVVPVLRRPSSRAEGRGRSGTGRGRGRGSRPLRDALRRVLHPSPGAEAPSPPPPPGTDRTSSPPTAPPPGLPPLRGGPLPVVALLVREDAASPLSRSRSRSHLLVHPPSPPPPSAAASPPSAWRGGLGRMKRTQTAAVTAAASFSIRIRIRARRP